MSAILLKYRNSDKRRCLLNKPHSKAALIQRHSSPYKNLDRDSRFIKLADPETARALTGLIKAIAKAKKDSQR